MAMVMVDTEDMVMVMAMVIVMEGTVMEVTDTDMAAMGMEDTAMDMVMVMEDTVTEGMVTAMGMDMAMVDIIRGQLKWKLLKSTLL